jgi:GT2 family glycosyltransferase
MKVAAVVITHNRKELLSEHLTSLLSPTRPPDEIIIITEYTLGISKIAKILPVSTSEIIHTTARAKNRVGFPA